MAFEGLAKLSRLAGRSGAVDCHGALGFTTEGTKVRGSRPTSLFLLAV